MLNDGYGKEKGPATPVVNHRTKIISESILTLLFYIAYLFN